MSDSAIELTRRRLLGGLVSIGAGSVAAGAGTMAYFSDTESSSGNDVTAGTLDLTIDSGNQTVSFFTETNLVPGDTGQATLPVSNAGTLGGYLDVSVAALTNYENGQPGNESSKDDTGGDPGQGNGELQDHLEVDAYFLNSSTGTETHLWSTGLEVIGTKFSTGTDYDVDYALPSGASRTFVIDWELPSDTTREAQSDSIDLELTFELGQEPGQ